MRIAQLLHHAYHLQESGFIEELFRQILHREPNKRELRSSMGLLASGNSKNDIIMSLINCEEAYNLYYQSAEDLSVHTAARRLRYLLTLKDEAFISFLYLELLCRSAEPEGHRGHLETLKLGAPRMDVINTFLSSDEWLSLLESDNIAGRIWGEVEEKNWVPPQGGYQTAWDWSKENVIEIYPEETIRYPEPQGIEPAWWDSNVVFPRAYVAVIPDGRLWGDYGSVITPDNKLVGDVSFSWNGPDHHDIFHQNELPPATYIPETVATLALVAPDLYFLWFFNYLPRIHLLRKSGIHIDKYVINGDLALPFQLESLSMLGIPRHKIISISSHSTFHLRAKRLVVPSVPSMSSYPKWSCDFIRDEFLKHKSSQSEYDRIYISRDDAWVRRIINEDQVMALLDCYGFQKVTLSSLSLAEQISLFHSAKIIAGPHGAGLTNLAFCSPGTKVIEFTYSEPRVSRNYWKICSFVGADYYCLLCEAEPLPASSARHWAHLIIDLNKLYRTLEYAGVKPL